MPSRPSVRAMSAMTPGRFGTTARSSRDGAADEPGLEERLALARGLGLPGGERRAVARRRARRGPRRRRATVSSIACSERVAVGEVDVGPQRRVGAGDARRVAEARAGRRQPLAPEGAGGLGDEDVGDDVRQVRHRGHHPVVGVGVDRGGLGAEAGHEAVQALERDARRRGRRREVPDGAVEQVLARVRDAGRLAARERVAADEALVAVGGDHAALRRADVGDDASGRRVREDRGDRLGQRAERDARRPRRRRRRARRRGRRGPRRSPRPRAPRRRAGRSRGPSRRACGGRPVRPTRRSRRRRRPRRSSRGRGFQEGDLARDGGGRLDLARVLAEALGRAAAAARRRWPPRAAGAPRR